MTHFYIEFSQEINNNKIKIRDFFEKKFPYVRFEKNNDYSLFAGDFIDGNFRIKKLNLQPIFQLIAILVLS